MLTTATIQLPPRQKFPSCRFSGSVLSRAGITSRYNSFLRVTRKRGREEGLSLESLFLSRLFRGRAPSFPRSIITFFPFLLARRSKTTIEEDVVSSVPPTNEREESSNAVTAILGRARLVSIAFSSGLMRSLEEIKG